MLTVSVIQQPKTYSPASGVGVVLPYKLMSNTSSFTSFKYVIDLNIYDQNTGNFLKKLSTHKIDSNPDGYGIYSPNEYLKTELSNPLNHTITQIVGNSFSACEYDINYGYEWKPNWTFFNTNEAFINGNYYLVLNVNGSNAPFEGDIIQLRMNNRFVNTEYNGTCSVQSATNTGTYSVIVTDRILGTAPVYPAIETGNIIYHRHVGTSSTDRKYTWDGTRQYREKNIDFADTYFLTRYGTSMSLIPNDNNWNYYTNSNATWSIVSQSGYVNNSTGQAVISAKLTLPWTQFFPLVVNVGLNNGVLAKIAVTSSFPITTQRYDVDNDTRVYVTSDGYIYASSLGLNQIGGSVSIAFTASFAVGDIDKRFLTTYNDWKPIFQNQYEIASFIGSPQSLYSPTASPNVFNGFMVRTYTSDFRQIATYSFTQSFFIQTTKYKRWECPTGTQNLENIGVSFSSNTAYYDVSVLYKYVPFGGTMSYDVLATQKRRIETNQSNYSNFRVAWLNRLGGWNFWNFNYQHIKTTNINRTEKRSVLGLNYQIGDRLQAILSTQVNETFVCNSDWLSERDHAFMEDLKTGPEAYLIDEETGEKLPILITDTNFVEKTYENDKLFNCTLAFKMSYDTILQDE